MSFGKVPLKEFLYKIPSGNCEICPSIGEDDAIIKVNEPYIAIHSDPITESSVDPGFLSIAVACNDVNMKGTRCKWVLTTILLSTKKSLDRILSGINEACSILGCNVVGGHTEVVMNLPSDIVVTTAFSTTDKVLTARNAKEGDYVVMVGSAGIEGTWILANQFEDYLLKAGVKKETIESAKRFKHDIIVQEKALKVSEYAIGMHDTTEGGVLQALMEISKLSNLRAVIDPSLIPVRRETLEITKALSIDYLRLVSSGAFLVVTRNPEEVMKKVSEGNVIGRLIKGGPGLHLEGVGDFNEDFEEELVRFEGSYNGGR
ncbi:AIR synthase-related protein [Acidianus sp. HS-5]|uniref:AIR synthase-related protein n=1 Tax=Acidianus sp. HS-5 TaxID=2886040 RepID=UPI001F29143D|nr:AIR synthase-related protein [Acidianus sp. HS-5]BDC18404.1 AIR synthase [Acidianus sp. HS-5]